MLTKSDNICKTQIINEIKNQKKMAGRPNFVDLKAVYEDANLIYLLMELWGIPLEKILTRRRALMEREVQLIFCQLIDILENLRSANVSHGNIALTTVLLATDQENFIQLTDFTHSHDLSTDGLGSDKNSYKGGSDHQSKTKWNLDNALSNE
jgi:serine/threonine protein kinase